MWKAILPGMNVFDSQYKSVLFSSKTSFGPTSKSKYQFFGYKQINHIIYPSLKWVDRKSYNLYTCTAFVQY